MLTTSHFIYSLLALLILVTAALAQERPTIGTPPPPVLTATASGSQLRYVALGEVQRMRLQVFDPAGQVVYDSAAHPGNLLDWQLADQQGAPLSDGAYLFLVSITNFSEQVTHKFGTLLVQQQQVSLQQTARDQLSTAQSQALLAEPGPALLSPVDRLGVEVPGADHSVATTLAVPGPSTTSVSPPTGQQTLRPATPIGPPLATSGTGTTGQLTKWTDGLNGVLGDSLLTEAGGNVGVGTTTPNRPLEVKGGTGSTEQLRLQAPTGGSAGLTLFDGGGNSAARSWGWRTNDGSWGNLKLYESGVPGGDPYSGSARLTVLSGGNVGVGTTTPRAPLVVQQAQASAPGMFNKGGLMVDTTNSGVALVMGGYTAGSPYTSYLQVIDDRAGIGVTYPLALQPVGGNVGVGTTTPGQALEVVGNVKVSGNGNGLIFPDATSMTTAGATLGANIFGGNQIVNGNLSTNNGSITANSASGNGVAGSSSDSTASGVAGSGGTGGVGGSAAGIGLPGHTGGAGMTGTGGTGGFGGVGNPGGAGGVGGTGVAGIGGQGGNGNGGAPKGPDGVGVSGTSGSGYGVQGSSITNTGMVGSGTTGVQGTASTNTGSGVYGVNSSNNNGNVPVGVSGYAPNGYGVQGVGYTAVYGNGSFTGVSGAGPAYGVQGASGDQGYGVYGTNSGSGTGVWGQGTGGTGVLGTSGLNAGYGVKGTNSSGGNLSYAVYGNSTNGYGVGGEGGNIGVYAHNLNSTGNTVYLATQGLAGDFYGDVNMHNKLTIGTGVNNNGGGFKHARLGITVNAGVQAIETVTWPNAFPDNNYTVSVVVEDSLGCIMLQRPVYTKDKSQISSLVLNQCGNQISATIHVIAIHD